MLCWRATMRDGSTLREDDPPCAWHAGFDDPHHASACLRERDVSLLEWLEQDAVVAMIAVPVGARAEVRRLHRIGIRDGSHTVVAEGLGWLSETTETWVTMRGGVLLHCPWDEVMP